MKTSDFLRFEKQKLFRHSNVNSSNFRDFFHWTALMVILNKKCCMLHIQYLHLLLVLGQHADVLLLLVVFLLHDGPLTLVQGYVLPWKDIQRTHSRILECWCILLSSWQSNSLNQSFIFTATTTVPPIVSVSPDSWMQRCSSSSTLSFKSAFSCMREVKRCWSFSMAACRAWWTSTGTPPSAESKAKYKAGSHNALNMFFYLYNIIFIYTIRSYHFCF